MSTEPIRRVTVAERIYRAPRYAGSRAELLCNPSGPVTELRAGVVAVEPGSVLPLHYHKRQTLELVLSGCGVVQGRDGREWPGVAGRYHAVCGGTGSRPPLADHRESPGRRPVRLSDARRRGRRVDVAGEPHGTSRTLVVSRCA